MFASAASVSSPRPAAASQPESTAVAAPGRIEPRLPLRLPINLQINGLTISHVTTFPECGLHRMRTHHTTRCDHDWHMIGDVALTSFIGYMGKNHLSEQSGKVLGTIG